MRDLGYLVVVVVLMAAWGAAPGWAQPKNEAGRRVERAAERVADEAVDAVVDEIAGEDQPSTSGMPPGLAKKGGMPPGLAKQGKVPPGWDKGKKAGWKDAPKKESWIRRAVRGIFSRKAPAETPAP